jgi:hypothetical protein
MHYGAQGVAIAHYPECVSWLAKCLAQLVTNVRETVELPLTSLSEPAGYRHDVIAVLPAAMAQAGLRFVILVARDAMLWRDVRRNHFQQVEL